MSSSILPAPYYYFFWLVEPILTLSAVFWSIFAPASYVDAMIPRGYEAMAAPLKRKIRERMLSGNLGSCFLLLAMISFSLFPLFKHELASNPRAQQKLIAGLLIPLAIADVIHVVLTLLPLPRALLLAPQTWTALLWGNAGTPIGLLLVRSLWFAGVGRRVVDESGPAKPGSRGTSVGAGGKKKRQ